jgi:hypothetical protein
MNWLAIPIPHCATTHRNRRTFLNRFRAVVFVRAGLRTAVELWLRKRCQACCPPRSLSNQRYRTDADGCPRTLGDCPGAAWLFAAELREGTVIRLLTPLERTVPILAVRPASRRLSTKVRIFIEHLEKTFALCSQQVSPDPPVGIKQYGKFWDMVEASINTMGCRRLLRFRPSTTGCIQAGLDKN